MLKHPVTIAVAVDVEEGFEWNGPSLPSDVDVSALSELPRAQGIFDRYGIIPAYLMTYPVANSWIGREVIRPLLNTGRCEIGAHLHPWVTPPSDEAVGASNSFPVDVPIELEDKKIGRLVAKIEESFSAKPRMFKADRCRLDLARAATLVRHGFLVDMSVTPDASRAEHDPGPDFFGLPEEPFWLNANRRLLAVPSTQSLVGQAGAVLAPSSRRRLFSPPFTTAKLPGILSRLGLLERLRLSPERTTLAEMKRLVDWRVDRGARSLCLSFHSPSLVPGFTPYVRTRAELEEFLSRLDGILAYITGKLDAEPVSVLEQHASYSRALESLEANAEIRAGFGTASAGPARVLLVSGFFLPRAPMGAIRTAKLAEHWRAAGADVRVLAIDKQPGSPTVEPAPDHVHYSRVTEPGALVTAMVQAARRLASPCLGRSGEPGLGFPPAADSEARPAADAAESDPGSHSLKSLYRQLVGYPDRYRRWVRAAVATARSWAPEWKPDIIYSSSPPHSGHLVAAQLSKMFGVPWIAELRDLWAGDPYADRHPWIEPFHDSLAQRTLCKASAHVAVSTLSAARVQVLTGRQAVVSYNGYDPADFAGLEDAEPYDPHRLTIIHAGVIYAGRRDPSPLFEALVSLGDAARDIRTLFFHDENGAVAALIERHGLAGRVEIRPAVPRRDILRLERQVDVLLECRWIDQAGDGVIPGKLFEYIGARRPILSLGSPTGEAAEIVRDNGFGLVSNDPPEIAARLVAWLDEKRRHGGRVPDLPGRAHERFQRAAQFRRVDRVVQQVIEEARRR